MLEPPTSELCAVCLKIIIKKKNQPRLSCNACASKVFISNALAVNSKYLFFFRLCCVAELSADGTLDSNDQHLCDKLHDISKLCGIKLIHQNIQSLGAKIDQLHLMMHELKSGIHLLTLSETWNKMLETENLKYPILVCLEKTETARMEWLPCM